MGSKFYLVLFVVLAMLAGCAPETHVAPVNPSVTQRVDFPIVSVMPAGDVASLAISTGEKPDSLWVVFRAGFQLPVDPDPRILKQATALASASRSLHINLANASIYFYYILEELDARKMPTELALIPFLESSFHPGIHPRFHAGGMWGIMTIAAKHMGLAQSSTKDERRDMILSTQSALNLLNEFHQEFGDWRIALAAYNWGPGNVKRLIAKQKSLRRAVDYDHLPMPQGVQNYVIKIMALRMVLGDPEKFNVVLPELANRPYLTAIEVSRDISLEVAANLAEISVAKFHTFNPSFNTKIIHAKPGQKILLPVEQAKLFYLNLDQYTGSLTQATKNPTR